MSLIGVISSLPSRFSPVHASRASAHLFSNHFIMVNFTLRRHHLDYVSRHVNQTHLVTELLSRELISYDDIHGLDEDTEVFQWLVFNNFGECDYERLSKSGIPFIDSEL